jgi:hypothetical protein
VPEAQLEDFGSALTPVTQGWFVVNVRDVEWWFAEGRCARCAFENEYGEPPVEFGQLGMNVTVLKPGQPTGRAGMGNRSRSDRARAPNGGGARAVLGRQRSQ